MGVFEFVLVVVAALLLSVVIRRLIVGVGWLRTFIVSAVVVSAPVPLVNWLGRVTDTFTRTGRPLGELWLEVAVLVLGFLWAFALAVAFLVVLELIVPTGSIPSPVDAVRQARAGLRRARRYLRLAWVMATSGLSRELRRGPSSDDFGQALVKALNRSGVTFIKLGQVLSTRPELLPAPIVDALASLQTAAAPAPSAQIRQLLTSEWGRAPEEVLAEFDEQPLAAASLAQVHRARLLDGRPVVIKVQRPGAREQVAVDCDIMLRFADVAERRFAWARSMGVAELARGLVASLREELDYRREATNTLAVAGGLKGHATITTPAIYPELIRERVLVLQMFEGQSATSGAERLTTEQRHGLARDLLEAIVDGILIRGVFHADLHPGNVMLLSDDRLGLLDFGAVGVLDSETRQLVAALLLALVTDDTVAASTALTTGFEFSHEVDQAALRRDVGRMITLVNASGQAGVTAFTELFTVLRTHGVVVPADVASAFRTLSCLDATLQVLDPAFGLLQGAQELLPKVTSRLTSPERLAQLARNSALTSGVISRRLPERLERITDLVARGELVVRTRSLADPSDRSWLRWLMDDAVSALFAVVGIVLAAVFLVMPGGPQLTPTLSAYDLAAAFIGFLGLVLSLRLIVRLFVRRRH